MPQHFSDGWPGHAEHHLFTGIGTNIGLTVVALLIIRGRLAAGEPWSWPALVVTGLAIYGTFWLSVATIGLHEAATAPYTVMTVLTALYLSGLVLAWYDQPTPTSGDRP